MQQKLEYSFDDEVVNKFFFDMDNKRIEIHFEGYFDVLNSQYIEKSCVWVIENWSDAKSKLISENNYANLEKNLGIFSMILSAEMNDTTLDLTVNTINNLYINLLFDNPQLKLKTKSLI